MNICSRLSVEFTRAVPIEVSAGSCGSLLSVYMCAVSMPLKPAWRALEMQSTLPHPGVPDGKIRNNSPPCTDLSQKKAWGFGSHHSSASSQFWGLYLQSWQDTWLICWTTMYWYETTSIQPRYKTLAKRHFCTPFPLGSFGPYKGHAPYCARRCARRLWAGSQREVKRDL